MPARLLLLLVSLPATASAQQLTAFTHVRLIDSNGLADVAFQEIDYDPSWSWANGANIDVESVALHEAGQGLSQGHFGNMLLRNGSVWVSPRAVMTSYYDSPLTTLLGTDKGGHCSIWASWPKN